jgi:hypothetical protein
MIRILVTTVIAIAMGACLAMNADDGASTSSTDQALGTRTCSPLIDTGKGGYWGCWVNEDGGPYIVTGVSQANCTTCGITLSHELCYEYQLDLPYCENHNPGGGGGGTGHGSLSCPDGCAAQADGLCRCTHIGVM